MRSHKSGNTQNDAKSLDGGNLGNQKPAQVKTFAGEPRRGAAYTRRRFSRRQRWMAGVIGGVFLLLVVAWASQTATIEVSAQKSPRSPSSEAVGEAAQSTDAAGERALNERGAATEDSEAATVATLKNGSDDTKKSASADLEDSAADLNDAARNAPAKTTATKTAAAKKTAATLVNLPPDDPQTSVYSYENNLGKPRGQVEMDSPNPAAATDIDHRAGIADFSFGVSLASLSGRGINASAAMTYNSRTWNEACLAYDASGQCSQHQFTYDVEQSWIAPGFTTGYGHLETTAALHPWHNIGSGHFYYATEIVPVGITDPDGTRHQLRCAGGYVVQNTDAYHCTSYQTTDGTFISTPARSWTGNPGNSQSVDTSGYAAASFTFSYPNGAKISYTGGYGGGTSRKHYPALLEDSNGNRIHVGYNADQSGRIDYIYDTIGRYIKFYYQNDANGSPDKLIAVTIPGMTANSEIQTVRFYYDTLSFSATDTGFASNSTVTAPTTPFKVLRYVYFPATKTGFRYDYHPKYGMIKRITRFAGMTADSTSTAATGAITSDGVIAASTAYDYPDGTTPLDDVPKYTKRTDDWQGRTSAASETFYNAPEPAVGDQTRVSTITVKDNGFDTEYQTISHNTGGWMDGLIKETSVKKASATGVLSKTAYTWAQGSTAFGGRNNPVLQKIETTDESGLTKATEFEYDGYGNQTKVKEHDYAAPGAVGTLLRTTDSIYETGAGWTGANFLGLVRTVKVTVGGIVVSKAEYEYDHNGNDATLLRRNDMDTTTHDIFYNPAHPAYTERVCPDDPGYGNYANGGSASSSSPDAPTTDSSGDGCINVYHPGYTAASAYRGNLTKITAYADATVTSDSNANITAYEYDIAGNGVSATLSCCNLKTTEYGANYAETGYAYPVSQTKGGSAAVQLTTSATYNVNTGLVLTSTDENAQITNYEYEIDTLRPKKTTAPNGAYSLTEYSDKLASGTSDLLPGYVRSTSTLDANRTVQSYSYFDGRGAGIRMATLTPDGWGIGAVEYDQLGRAVKSYNPFYAPTKLAQIPANTPFTQTTQIDSLGRATEIKLQDDTMVTTAFSNATNTPTGFNKTFMTVTDQAGKQRRQVMDALGRIVRVDEPTTAGLGSVTSPNQPTAYEYDGNDNLVKTTQTDNTSGQTTVQERLFKYDSLSRMVAEKQVEATATLNDAGAKVGSGGSWTKVLKYDVRGHVTDGYDARGVGTHFVYDGLNRVSSVTYSDGTPTVTYTYDQARTGFYNKGALTRVETAAGGTARPDTPTTATEFDYDAMGRAVKHRQSIGTQTYSLEYGYNLGGQMTREKYPSGRTVVTNYDNAGRSLSIADQTGTYAYGFQYQGKGNSISGYNLGNGTKESFTLNDRMQLVSQSLTRGTDVLQKYDYGFGQIDANGNLDATKNNGQLAKVDSYIGTAKQATKKYSYDNLGRLGKEEEYRGDDNALVYRQNFDFDNFGNLYKKAANNPTARQQNPIGFTPIETADINKSTNQLTTNTVYDEAGNVRQDTKFRNLNYAYDANGRMIASSGTADSSINSSAVYDAAGQRVAEKVNGSWKLQVYDLSSHLVAEYTDATPTSTGNISYIFADSQGSTRAVTSKAGAIQSRTDYQAFGDVIGAGTGQRTVNQGFNGNSNINQKFAQTERDEATELDHTSWRKHENKAGRWTSPDPYNGSQSIGDPQSFNKYSYTQNQPTNYIDPSGLNLAFYCYDLTTFGHIGERSVTATTTICHYTNDPNSGIGSGGNGGFEGGGGGVTDPQQSTPKKINCSQDKDGKNNQNEIEDYLKRAGVFTLIDVSSISVSKEGIVFDFIDRATAVSFLDGSLQVIGPTIFNGQHTSQVGGGARDYRGKTGQGELGSKSLQIEVGRKGSAERQKNKALGARGYADLDCDNPAQDVVNFVRHSTHIISEGFRKIF